MPTRRIIDHAERLTLALLAVSVSVLVLWAAVLSSLILWALGYAVVVEYALMGISVALMVAMVGSWCAIRVDFLGWTPWWGWLLLVLSTVGFFASAWL